MNESREILALRKDLLVARAQLQRLKIARQVGELRASLSWRNAAATLTSSPGRSLGFGLLLLLAGRSKVANLVRIAAGVVALAKVAGAFATTRPGARSRGEKAPSPDRDSLRTSED
jgi:hypothetical protein